MPSLLNPKLERGRAILFEAYAGEQILGVRTSRYLYTEWDGDTNPALPQKELYDTYADPYQLNNLANDPAYLTRRARARPGARRPDRLRRRRLPRRADRASSPSPTAGSARMAAWSPPVDSAGSPVPRRTRSSASPSAPAGSPSATTPIAPFEIAIPDAAIRDELPQAGRR